jgi:hypothetical protein
MNNPLKTDWIRRRARKAAQEFTSKGYQVDLNADREALPDPLGSYQPHLLAQNDQDTVLVEFTSTPDLLAESDRFLQIALAVQALPGWRFELRVSNAKSPAGLEPWSSSSPLGKRDIYARIGEVQALLQSEHLQAALLVQWTATEAVLRRLASQEEIAYRPSDRKHLIKQLFSSGLISRQDYDLLLYAASLGLAIILGFESELPSIELLRQLVQITIRLLRE